MDWSDVCQISWNLLILVGVIPIYIASKCFNFRIICVLGILKLLLCVRFFTRFPLSLLILPCHGETLMTESNMLQLLSMVLVTCGCGLPMALYGLIPIFSFVFHPKSTLIPLPILQLPKGEFRSPCPRLLMEVLAWLDLVVKFMSNCALPISRYFGPIVTIDNKRFSVLVQLVSVDLSAADVDICLAVFLPNGRSMILVLVLYCRYKERNVFQFLL